MSEIPIAAFTESNAATRPFAGSGRPVVRSGAVIYRLRNAVLNEWQPGQPDAHRPDAGGNQANAGALRSRVESPAQVWTRPANWGATAPVNRALTRVAPIVRWCWRHERVIYLVGATLSLAAMLLSLAVMAWLTVTGLEGLAA